MAFKKQYGAKKIIAVISFLFTRRTDHEEPEYNFEINYLRFCLEILAFAGVDIIISCTPHSEAMSKISQEVGIEFIPVYMDFSPTIKTITPKDEPLVFYSPDEGSVLRAVYHARNFYNSKVVFDFKRRKLNNKTEILESLDVDEIKKIKELALERFGYDQVFHSDEVDISGFQVVMIEDELASGGTANTTARKLIMKGAKSIIFAFTHPVCTTGWKSSLFFENPFIRIMSTDSIPRGPEKRTMGRILDISVARDLSSAIYKKL